MTNLERVVAESKRLPQTTKRMYRSVVRRFVDFAGSAPTSWTPGAVEAWLATLAVRPQSLNVYICALRYASRRHATLHGARDFAGALETVLVPATKHRTGATVLSREQIELILASCSGAAPRDMRDRALIVLGLYTGFRRAELAGIELDDLDAVGRAVVVIAKRNRRHVVKVSAGCWNALAPWLAWLRRRRIRDGRLFRGLRRCLDAEAGYVVTRGLKPDGVYGVIRRRAARAGVHGVSPHSLRHSCAALLREGGVPEAQIAARLGHAAVTTTGLYGGDYVTPASDGGLPF